MEGLHLSPGLRAAGGLPEELMECPGRGLSGDSSSNCCLCDPDLDKRKKMRQDETKVLHKNMLIFSFS